jgi:hypothetical protein
MKARIGLIALSIALAVPLAVPLGHLTPVAAEGREDNCKVKNNSKEKTKCDRGTTVAIWNGQFQVPVFGTHVVLTGQASMASHGAQIFAQRIAASHTPRNGVAFRVFVVGHLPRLSLVGRGHLDEYVIARDSWVRVQAITRPGIYAAIS